MDWTGICERAAYDTGRQMVYGGPMTRPQMILRLRTYETNPEAGMYQDFRDNLMTRRTWLR